MKRIKQIVRATVLNLVWDGARRRARREKPTVVAVTGSVGKTSAKEAIAAVLQQTDRPVVKTAGNLNTDFGVPLSLLGYEEAPVRLEWLPAIIRALRLPRSSVGPPYYVLEYSADRPGDIAYLCRQMPPDISALTLISPVHLENYPSLEALAKEKLTLVEARKPGGTAVLNYDDPIQRARGEAAEGVAWYGMVDRPVRRPGVWCREVTGHEKGLSCVIDFVRAGELVRSFPLRTAVLGEHQLGALLVACAVGWQEKVPFEKIKSALEAYRLPPGRGRIIEGQKDIVLIDESYNASPASVKAGLSMLRRLAGRRRVVAMLGRMNELGGAALEAHREIASTAAECVDYLIVVGEYGEEMLEAARAKGMPSGQMIAFSTPEVLLDKMEQVVKRGDLVYIKGSQNGVRLERAVKRLMARPGEADRLLVRQGKQWKS